MDNKLLIGFLVLLLFGLFVIKFFGKVVGMLAGVGFWLALLIIILAILIFIMFFIYGGDSF